MPDVFISYSRKDQDWVRWLNDQLIEQGRDVWVDWEGIEPSEEWLKAIYAAIDEASVFVFVLSPDSVGSDVCRQEVEHALRSGKRIVPVVCRDVSGEAVSKDIARFNYVFIRPNDDREVGLEKLVRAIDSDFEHLKRHTKLLVHAREWDQGGRRRGRLLRGDALQDADRWLLEVGDKQPRPTPLHADFIQASRRLAQRRMRASLAGVSIALAVAIGLAIVALVARQEANRNAIEAKHEATLGAMEVGLRLRAEGERAQSLLWLARGLRLATDAELHDVADVLRVHLAADLQHTHRLRQVLEHGGTVYDAMFGPEAGAANGVGESDGGQVITGGIDGTVRVWDGTSAEVVRQFRDDASNVVYDIELTADGKTLIAADGAAAIWNYETGEKIRRINVPDRAYGVISVAVDSNSKRLAAGYSNGSYALIDFNTGATIKAFTQTGGQTWAVDFTRDGKVFMAAGYKPDDRRGWWRTWHADSLQPQCNEVLTDGFIWAASFSPDDQFIATGGVGSGHTQAALFDMSACSEAMLSRFNHEGSILALAFNEHGDRIMTGSRDATARIWDTQTATPIGNPLKHGDLVWSVAFDQSGERALTGSADGLVRLWEVAKPYQPAVTVQHQKWVEQAKFSADGKWILTACWDHTARIADALTGETIVELPHTSEPNGDPDVLAIDQHPDGVTLLTGCRDGYLRLWDIESRSEKAKLEHGTVVYIAAFSPDGQAILSAGEDKLVQIWNTADGTIQHTLQHEGAVLAASFSSDGKHVLTGGTDRKARLWDASTGKLIWAVEHDGDVLTVGFGSNGQALTGGRDKMVVLRDAQTGVAIRTFPHPDDVRSAALSPDGSLLLVGCRNKQPQLWDVATGMAFPSPPPHTGLLRGVAFHPSIHGRVLTCGEDGAAQVWQLPKPLMDDSTAVQILVETVTGLAFDKNRAVQVLNAKQWRDRRQRLDQINTN